MLGISQINSQLFNILASVESLSDHSDECDRLLVWRGFVSIIGCKVADYARLTV
ncbi:hypothetical protein [Nostoc sp.]|uniref:hypothetical protein n=1 Tax=Nostoc sp. TaxID=1180 RepID=UPI002FF6F60C